MAQDHRRCVVMSQRIFVVGDSPHMREFSRSAYSREEARLANLLNGQLLGVNDFRIILPQVRAELAEVLRQRVYGRPLGQPAAVIDLDEIDPPGCESLRVLLVVPPAPRQGLAGPGADRGVNTEPQPESVNLVGQP